MMPSWHLKCVRFPVMMGIVPVSTYRVQLSADFMLNDLANQVTYLAELGITDIYLSPIYAARPGSPHSYDMSTTAEWTPSSAVAKAGGDCVTHCTVVESEWFWMWFQ